MQMTWTTSSRLLKLGESVEFRFHVPTGATTGDLKIYSRYLEESDPGTQFSPGGELNWLAALPFEQIALTFNGGQAAASYTPKHPGSYLAVWRAGDETYYRYFAAINDRYIVLSFATFFGLDPQPTFHALGIPLDYRLPLAQFSPDDPLGRRLLSYNRRFGELVVPAFPDLPEAKHDELVRFYGEGLKKARALLPDPLDHRSIRVDMNHNEDPGYPRAFSELGVNDHCGLWEANCPPWLGMPEFLYYAAPEDCRKVNQSAGGSVVAHQWDFCGSFHFLGPVDWHYTASEGLFERTEACLRDGLGEFRNAVEMSGHPLFVTPLYGGPDKSCAYPDSVFHVSDDRRGAAAFCEQYLRFIAFKVPKEYPVVFTRSIDMVDYFRRHFPATPRTLFSCRTRHALYDAWWQGALNNYGVFYTPHRIPWSTRISTARRMREAAILPEKQSIVPFKDSLSCEFILLEDQQRQVRFERECPNPVWWFDYTRQERNDKGSLVRAVETPDVRILRSQDFSPKTGLTITLKMNTEAEFPGYAIALWGLPIDYSMAPDDIVTTAHSYTLVKNVDGETHMVLCFDLKPDVELEIILRKPTAKQWEW